MKRIHSLLMENFSPYKVFKGKTSTLEVLISLILTIESLQQQSMSRDFVDTYSRSLKVKDNIPKSRLYAFSKGRSR